MNETGVRDMVIDLWTTTRGGDDRLGDRVAAAFRARPELPLTEKALVVRRLYDMVRLRRWVGYRLDDAVPAEFDERGRALAWLVVTMVSTGELTDEAARAMMPRLAWERIADAESRIALEADPVRRFAVRHSLPDFLAHELMQELGDRAVDFARAVNLHPAVTIRVNAALTSRQDVEATFAADGVATHPTAHSPFGLVLDGPADVFRMQAFAAGHFELQDEASQLVAEVVAPPPGGRVIDVCAGAGGKTLAIAALLRGKGRILALDTSAKRLEELRRRARRARVHQTRAVVVPDDAWPDEVKARIAGAHRVLLDVPCSGFGSLRRHPDMRWKMTPAELPRLESIQASLVRRAADLLAPGARMIYATCTIRRGENRAIVEGLLAERPEFEVVRLGEILGTPRALAISEPSATFLEMLPHVHGTDGFFAAVLRRRRVP